MTIKAQVDSGDEMVRPGETFREWADRREPVVTLRERTTEEKWSYVDGYRAALRAMERNPGQGSLYQEIMDDIVTTLPPREEATR